MKTSIIYISILLMFLNWNSHMYAQTSTRNYIYTRTYTDETNTNYRDVIRYFNGLGYPEQTVRKNFSPTHKDVINSQDYDGFSRETCSWLPAAIPDNNGSYIQPYILNANVKAFYGNDSQPYSEKIYTLFSQDRISEEFGPGSDWHTNGKSVKTEYLTNVDNTGDLACALFKVKGSGVDSKLARTGYYATGTLDVTKVTDEDGNVTYEFKDKLGQVLLVRQKNAQESLDTYHVFDDFGNICFILPPSVSDSLNADGTWNETTLTSIANFAYLYKYDSRGRCISKKLPGCDWTYYVYDRSDRQIFVQDGELRLKGEWLFSIPDALGRPALTGICKNNLNYSDNPLSDVCIQGMRSNATNITKGYIVSGISLTTPVILTVNYYDNYDFMGYNGIPDAINADMKYEVVQGFGIRYEDSKGLLTGTLVAQLPADGTASASFLNSVLYYDYRGRVIQAKAENHLGGTEKVYTAYSFTGNPLHVKKVHTASGKDTQMEVYTYTYDNAERLLKTMYQLNNATAVTLVDNAYDEVGRLKSNSRNGNAKLKTEYTHNLRSWTKSITGSLFNQTINYQENVAGNTPCYNGNISSMSWKSGAETVERGYRFTYDGLSRLKNATYGEGNNLANNSNRFNEQITGYDKMGNILGLQRYGQTAASTYGLIDNLTLTYNGNQLQAVKDASTNSVYGNGTEFKDGTNQTIEYVYDKNGNMTKDLNKNISNIGYNCLNLSDQITFANGNSIKYDYEMDGTKLRTVHKIGTTTLTMDYCGNVVYENGALKMLLNEAGYVSFPDKKYHFYLNDHQGNIRVVADKDGIVEETNVYYPFGGTFTSANSVQPYKYNGKELDQKNGLNWYDYGARHYDAAIGRWHVVDPMNENRYTVSTYTYASNSPVNRVDLDGKLDDWVEDKSKRIYWDPDATSQVTTKPSETYLGKTVVDFKGSRQETFGTKNGKSGYINGEGAITAQVTVYGANGPDDIHNFTGYSMSSDAKVLGAIDEGIYDGNYDVIGKSGSLKSNWVLNHRGAIRTLDGQINPNVPNQISANGEGYKDQIFIHSTNSNGFAGVGDGWAISKGCLLISPKDWNRFNGVMSGTQNFKVRVSRSNIEKVPLQGVTGPVTGVNIINKKVIY